MNPSIKLIYLALFIAVADQGKLAICSDSGEESSTSTLQAPDSSGHSGDLYGSLHYAGYSYGWNLTEDGSQPAQSAESGNSSTVASTELKELRKLVEDKKAWVEKVVQEHKKVVTTVERFTTYEQDGEKKKTSLGSVVEVIEGDEAMKKLDELKSLLNEAEASMNKFQEAKSKVDLLTKWDDSDSLLPTAPGFTDQEDFNFKELANKHLHRLTMDNKMFEDVFTILFGIKYDLIKIREGTYMLKQENELLKKKLNGLLGQKPTDAQEAGESPVPYDPSAEFALSFYVVDPTDSKLKQLDKSSFHHDFFREDRLHQYKFKTDTTKCMEIKHKDKEVWKYDTAKNDGKHPELVSYVDGFLTIAFDDHYVVYEKDPENEFSVRTEHRLKLLRVHDPSETQPAETAEPAENGDVQTLTHVPQSSPLGNLYPESGGYLVGYASKPSEPVQQPLNGDDSKKNHNETYTVPKSLPLTVELNHNHYSTKRCGNSVFDFVLKEGSKCVEIKYVETKVDLKNNSHHSPLEVTVWKQNEQSLAHPTSISFTKNRMIVHFREAYIVFKNNNTHWVTEFV